MSIKVNSRELYNIVCSEKLTVRSTRWNKSPYNIMRWCDLVAQWLHSWTRDMRVNLWRVRIPSIPFKNEICSYIIFFRTRKSARKFCIPVSLPLVNTKEILIMRSGNAETPLHVSVINFGQCCPTDAADSIYLRRKILIYKNTTKYKYRRCEDCRNCLRSTLQAYMPPN